MTHDGTGIKVMHPGGKKGWSIQRTGDKWYQDNVGARLAMERGGLPPGTRARLLIHAGVPAAAAVGLVDSLSRRVGSEPLFLDLLLAPAVQ